jgi:hypothetical protein
VWLNRDSVAFLGHKDVDIRVVVTGVVECRNEIEGNACRVVDTLEVLSELVTIGGLANLTGYG